MRYHPSHEPYQWVQGSWIFSHDEFSLKHRRDSKKWDSSFSESPPNSRFGWRVVVKWLACWTIIIHILGSACRRQEHLEVGGMMSEMHAGRGDDSWESSESDKICMMMTRLACNRAIESSYWRTDSDSDVGLLTSYVLYQLPVELEFMDLDTFPRWFGLHPSLLTSW
jgi:hypothetical protein